MLRVILIKGPPGAGKTTLASRLVEQIGRRGEPVAVIHADYLVRMIYGPEITTAILEMKYRNLRLIMSNHLKAGYSLVVEDLIRRPKDLKAMLTTARRYTKDITVIDLRVPLERSKRRCQIRDGIQFSNHTTLDCFKKRYQLACSVHVPQELAFDTAMIPPARLARKVIESFSGKLGPYTVSSRQ